MKGADCTGIQCVLQITFIHYLGVTGSSSSKALVAKPFKPLESLMVSIFILSYCSQNQCATKALEVDGSP